MPPRTSVFKTSGTTKTVSAHPDGNRGGSLTSMKTAGQEMEESARANLSPVVVSRAGTMTPGLSLWPLERSAPSK